MGDGREFAVGRKVSPLPIQRDTWRKRQQAQMTDLQVEAEVSLKQHLVGTVNVSRPHKVPGNTMV